MLLSLLILVVMTTGTRGDELYETIIERKFDIKIDDKFEICAWKNCSVEEALKEHKYVVIEMEREIEDIFSVDVMHECNVEIIVFKGPVMLEKSLVENCPNLTHIYFEGEDYNCKDKSWLEFIVFAQRRRVTLYAKESENSNACKTTLSTCSNYSFLVHIICTEAEKKCKEDWTCKCCAKNIDNYEVYIECTNEYDVILPIETSALFIDKIKEAEKYCKKLKNCRCCSKNYNNLISVECTNGSFTNSDIPHEFPRKTNYLFFDKNNLTDATEWIEIILSNYEFVNVINLANNQLKNIPFIPKSKNKLGYIFLDNNSIVKLDANALSSYLEYNDLSISLGGNKFICDCETPDFNDLLRANLKFFGDYKTIFCEHFETKEKGRPWTFDYSSCAKKFNPWSLVDRIPQHKYDILIFIALVLNCVVIAIFINVRLALNEVLEGNVNGRVPWIHHIWQYICTSRMGRYFFSTYERKRY